MPNFWRKRSPHENQSEPLVLMRAAPSEPARFSGSRTFGDYVLLNWETEYGTIGWAHPTHTAHTSAVSLSHAMYEHLWDHMHKAYTTLVVPLLLVNPDQSPELRAVDLYPGGRMSEEYEPTWHQLAAFLGTSVPWFHYALRDKKTIADWKPGDPPAIVPAQDAGLRTGPLLELAADEPDGSPAAAVCLWLARHLRRLDAAAAQRDISEIRAAAKDPDSDCAYVRIAAVPAPVARPADDEPGETTRRAAWAQITERRDVLAEAVAKVVLQCDRWFRETPIVDRRVRGDLPLTLCLAASVCFRSSTWPLVCPARLG